MSIVLAGLSDHESAAIEIMVKMTWNDTTCVTVSRNLNLGLPKQNKKAQECRTCVIDLYGMGMRRYSEENEAQLLEFLAGRSAILLVWGAGGGWLESDIKTKPRQELIWIKTPYSRIDMKNAIAQLHKGLEMPQQTLSKNKIHYKEQAQRQIKKQDFSIFESQASSKIFETLDEKEIKAPAPVPSPATSPAEKKAAPPPAWQRAMNMAENIKKPFDISQIKAKKQIEKLNSEFPKTEQFESQFPSTHPQPIALPIVTLTDDFITLNEGAFEFTMTIFPEIKNDPFIKLLEQLVMRIGPQLLKSGNQTALIFSMRGGWIASNLPTSALVKTLHTRWFLEGSTLIQIAPNMVEEKVRESFGGRFLRVQKPIDAVLWELVADAIAPYLQSNKLRPRGDMLFQLRNIPDFTQLSNVGPLDVQLASICARIPQSFSSLLRAFPENEKDITRFILCSILSTIAVIKPLTKDFVPSAIAQQQQEQAIKIAQSVREKPRLQKGFFKQILNKLFVK